MGYWENTTYIRTPDVARVAKALTKVFAREGYEATPRPAARSARRGGPMQYSDSEKNPLWAVAIIPGLAGWAVIKTAPFELLGERAKGADGPRISMLTRELGVDAFIYNIFDSAESLIVEAAADGRVRVTGAPEKLIHYNDDTGEVTLLPYHGTAIDMVDPRAFKLIEIDQEIRDAVYAHADEQVLGHLLAGSSGAHSNLVQVEHLIAAKPLTLPGVIEIYFRNKWN